MISKGKGGSHTGTGLHFEKGKDIFSMIREIPGYTTKGDSVFYKGEEVARSYKKRKLYSFLKSQGINYLDFVSKRLEPDEAVHVIRGKTLFVIEMKYQQTSGSVDEKLQTCDFKKKQYEKLVAPLDIKVEYIYLLSDWFKKTQYRGVLEYVTSVGCHYFFDELPLSVLGLPVPI